MAGGSNADKSGAAVVFSSPQPIAAQVVTKIPAASVCRTLFTSTLFTDRRVVATTVPERLHAALSPPPAFEKDRPLLPRISVAMPQFFEVDRLPGHLRTFHLHMRAAALRPIVLSLCVVAGCGAGNGDAPIASRLQTIEAEIFTPSCTFSSCHGATSPEQDMSLASPAWGAIVGVRSTEVSDLLRVAPGDAAGSYLWQKISNPSPQIGVRMPPDQPLSLSAIEAIRAWIANGAANE